MTDEDNEWKHRFPGRESAKFHKMYKVEFGELTAKDANLRADLVQLMRRALSGSVRSTDCVCYEVGWPSSAVVHEIGLNVKIDHYRLYFSDPSCEPTVLVFLIPTVKPSSTVSDDWHLIQDEHIREAKQRAGDWISEWYAGGL
ncbi:hypothetical protein [Rhodococcoides fascians]|uniref:hypothetical protein n=1 Tax=Rhodococcoides fascians TaxID=1828 RepID=UPI00050BFE51|nr:hypothetical protein [Rhodococcus fascians]